jgi:hypothetical protein
MHQSPRPITPQLKVGQQHQSPGYGGSIKSQPSLGLQLVPMADLPDPGLPEVPLPLHSYVNVNVNIICRLGGWRIFLRQLTATDETYAYSSLPGHLNSCCPMPVAEATVMSPWPPAAFSIAAVGHTSLASTFMFDIFLYTTWRPLLIVQETSENSPHKTSASGAKDQCQWSSRPVPMVPQTIADFPEDD